MVTTRGGDTTPAGLRQREHPDDVDDLLRAHPLKQPDSGNFPAAVGESGSSGYIV